MKKIIRWLAKQWDTELYVEIIAVEQLYWNLYSLCEALDSAHKPSYSGAVELCRCDAKELLLMLRGSRVRVQRHDLRFVVYICQFLHVRRPDRLEHRPARWFSDQPVHEWRTSCRVQCSVREHVPIPVWFTRPHPLRGDVA